MESSSPQNKRRKTEPSDVSDTPSGSVYQVFLSFRGPDTRLGFTDFLYEDLVSAGVCTFLDNEELRTGEDIRPDLLTAIEESKIFIPVLSKGYASSKWCLRELAHAVECKKTILPIFYDVTPDDVKHPDKGWCANAFLQHEKVFGKQTVAEWRKALRLVGKLKGWEAEKVAGGHQGKLVKIVSSRALDQLKSGSLPEIECLVGLNDPTDEVLKLLVASVKCG